MLSGVIRPAIKDKCGDIESSINFREVMISCNFFKFGEYLILPYIKKVSLNPYQFEYRNDSSQFWLIVFYVKRWNLIWIAIVVFMGVYLT